MAKQGFDRVGELERYAAYPSRHIVARTIDVWCPPGYAASTARYPVIYMHDGQNIFVPELAFTGIDWGADEAVAGLIGPDFAGAIVVGIWNTEERRRDYMPERPFHEPANAALRSEYLRDHSGPPQADAYLRMLVEEVKPLIDATYRTLPGREQTIVAGSSMGGLISLYALCAYPEVFGAAGCLSTHWPIGGQALLDYFAAALPEAGAHRLYFDYGTAGLDAAYAPFQARMDAAAAARGYVQGHDILTRAFPGADHNEQAWRERLPLVLRFLLGLGIAE